MRSHLSGNDEQFIFSYGPPNNPPVSSAAVARYIKTLELTKIDMTVLTGYSTRSAPD